MRGVRRRLSTSPAAAKRLCEIRRSSPAPGAPVANSALATDPRPRLLPLLLHALPETGGRLHVTTQMYAWDSLAQRDEAMERAAKDPEAQEFFAAMRNGCLEEESSIYVEATGTLQAVGLDGICGFDGGQDGDNTGIYEFRKYQLKLGYTTVPSFLEFYGAGLPSKLAADPNAKLVTLLYSDIGNLNEVFEVWRHNDVSAMSLSREASRKAGEWRRSIASIAELAQSFNTTIMRPMPTSNWF